MSLKQVQTRHEETEVDTNGHKSVLSMVPTAVRNAIIYAQQVHPEWCDKSEQELVSLIQPNDMADRLRVSFWREYARVSQETSPMNMTNVYGRLVAKNTFYLFLKIPANVIWMMTPTVDIMLSNAASLQYGKDHIGKIVKEGPFDKFGNLDSKKAMVFLRAYQILMDRVLGAVIQRVQQQTQTTHITQPSIIPTAEELKDLGIIDVSANDKTDS